MKTTKELTILAITYLGMALFMCSIPILALLLMSTMVNAEMTEVEFAAEVAAQVAEYDQEFDDLYENVQPLYQELENALGQGDETRALSAQAQINQLERELDDVAGKKIKYLSAADKHARAKFNKALSVIMPMPGVLDFGIALYLFQNTCEEYGFFAAVADTGISSLPDGVQATMHATTMPVAAAALVTVSIPYQFQQMQDWINRTNTILKGTTCQGNKCRTPEYSYEQTLAGINAAIAQVQSKPTVVYDPSTTDPNGTSYTFNGITYNSSHFKLYTQKADHLAELYKIRECIQSLGANNWIKGGDANEDDIVDDQDLEIFLEHFGGQGKNWDQGNFNHDPLGKVDFADFLILSTNYQIDMGVAPPPPN